MPHDRRITTPVRRIVAALAMVMVTTVTACSEDQVAMAPGGCHVPVSGQAAPDADLLRIASVEDALRWFDGIDPDRIAVRTVPRALVAELPGDFDALQSPDARKRAFVAIALPLVLKANEDIRAERRFVEHAAACLDAGLEPDSATRRRLDALSRRYDAEGDLALLLRRVDVVPPSLVLAQAAIESGWGTSRFALEGNALFGQRVWSSGDGMKPEALTADTPVRVASFPDLLASVRAYLHNLNTHAAYRPFRQKRETLRGEGRGPDGAALAPLLTSYSERGAEYVRDLHTIIKQNAFYGFDSARLARAKFFGPGV